MKKSKFLAASLAAVLAVSGLSLTSSSQLSSLTSVNAEAASSSARPKSMKLENKTVKFLAHYDPFNASSAGGKKSAALEYFEKNYDGKADWYPTTWDSRYSDLSTYVLGGEGIDVFFYDSYALPKGITSGMFQPVDSYVDLKSNLWKNVSTLADNFNFGGDHYLMVTGAEAENVVLYDKTTIKKYKLSDPYTLWTKGKWNWNTFENMLKKYVDPYEECYGLDGYWAEKALYTSAGVPAVSAKNGTLKSNLNNSTFGKAMDFEYDLYTNGLVIDRSLFDWSEQPQFMGEGKELFYIVGTWDLEGDPQTWRTKIDPDNLRMAPVPSPKGSKNYMGVSVSGLCLIKGAQNPKGAARLAECALYTGFVAPDTKTEKKKLKEDYRWNSTAIKQYYAINKAALRYPVVELAQGVSNDVASITTDGGDMIGVRAALHGYKWGPNRDDIAGVTDTLVKEADEQIKAK